MYRHDFGFWMTVGQLSVYMMEKLFFHNFFNLFTSVELLINGEKEDVELMLKNFNNSPEALNQIITSFVIMKK